MFLKQDGFIKFESISHLSPVERDEVICHWMRVNDSVGGGAVGFYSGASYDEVAEVLDEHMSDVENNRSVMVRACDGEKLVGFAWWQRGFYNDESLHVATLKRLQVDPACKGHGIGSKLMDVLHSQEVLNLMPGVEFYHLQYRISQGLGSWYSKYGYKEMAQFDMFMKNSRGEPDGWREMLRRVDGTPW